MKAMMLLSCILTAVPASAQETWFSEQSVGELRTHILRSASNPWPQDVPGVTGLFIIALDAYTRIEPQRGMDTPEKLRGSLKELLARMDADYTQHAAEPTDPVQKRVLLTIHEHMVPALGRALEAKAGGLDEYVDRLENAFQAVDSIVRKADTPESAAQALDELFRSWGQAPGRPFEWVSIPGGTFTMGTDDQGDFFQDAKPIHKVAVKDFELSKTLVTVGQYGECVLEGRCTQPNTMLSYCNWGNAALNAALKDHPVNCVDWDQANQYAKFMGARLPSEAEYEYAATSGGKNQKYPWGNEEASCDRAVMSGIGGNGCSRGGTMPVCSKPAGNSAQGVCDIVGNVAEWMQDTYKNSYGGAPKDGGAFEASGSQRVVRGGSWSNFDGPSLRADQRHHASHDFPNPRTGLRLARSSR